jgi:predicted permease
MRGFRDDIRYAVRQLGQHPGFTAIAVLALGLGLGANTAIFTLIHAVMFRPLPVTRPAELYRLGDTNDCCVNSGLPRKFSLFSYPLYRQLRDELPEFSDLAAFQANVTPTGIRPADGGVAQSLLAKYVSDNYFTMLGVTAAAGRLFQPGDDAPGADPVVVISHEAWTEQYGGDPAVVGRAVYVNGTAMTLVGVAAAGFFGETVQPNPASLWLPLGKEAGIRGASSLLSRPDQNWLYAIGRVKPDMEPDAIGTRATHVLQAWLGTQTFLNDRDRARIPDQTITVTSVRTGVPLMRENFGPSLTLLFAMSGLVLLIASANLANLLLARADRGQAAIRAALGASARRLMQQSLAVGLVLSAAGAAAALVIAMFATRAILALAFATPATVPMDIAPSAPIVLFSLALAVVTAILFTAAPAWAMARTNPIEALRGLGRNGRDVAFMPRRSLVVVQVTLSLVLLAGAGVLSKSLSRLEHQPLGFDPENRLIVRIDPPQIASDPARLGAMYDAMQDRLGRVPGVQNVSYALYSPMEGNNWSSGIYIAGRTAAPDADNGSSWNRVGPRYFETMGTRLARGRLITAADTPTSPHVAVVNGAFVRKFFPTGEALGARFGIGDSRNTGDYEIVGVVDDVKYSGANRPARPMAFLPVMQWATYQSPEMRQVQARSSLVRTIELQLAPGAASLERAIRNELAIVHPDLTVTRVVPMAEQIGGNFRTNRLLAALTATYGGLALALASLGLYGVTAYGVSRRLREIGVRMALGAGRGRIVWTIVRSALLQTLTGLVIGVPLALAAGGALTAQLFDVNARDPLVLAIASLALIITAAMAAVIPARRAASVDPTQALRAQ